MRPDDFRGLMRYSDWANRSVLAAARGLDDPKLDQRFEMGLGSLRRTLIHIYNGEFVWLQRWQGHTETKWPAESERVAVSELEARFEQVWRARDAYLERLSEDTLGKIVIYRDSKGSPFQATLANMLIQMFVHSTHHRAQVANMLRQLGAGLVELDYMMSLRTPVQTFA